MPRYFTSSRRDYPILSWPIRAPSTQCDVPRLDDPIRAKATGQTITYLPNPRRRDWPCRYCPSPCHSLRRAISCRFPTSRAVATGHLGSSRLKPTRHAIPVLVTTIRCDWPIPATPERCDVPNRTRTARLGATCPNDSDRIIPPRLAATLLPKSFQPLLRFDQRRPMYEYVTQRKLCETQIT